ncbi:MAG: glycine cleavage system protein GcvH [Polyangiaceae bacterium]
MSNVKADLKYTKDHEWARAQGATIDVGISHYAVEQLGDITLVNLDVKEGDRVTKGAAFGTIESVKTLSDLFSPVSGKVTRINGALVDKPELVNADCYEAWMLTIEADDAREIDELLTASAYEELLKSVG